QSAGAAVDRDDLRQRHAGGDECEHGREHRRQSGAPEHAAVPHGQLLHRTAGDLPLADIGEDVKMAQPYVGEIRMFAGNFAPAGWMFCDGQLLPISENETLFQLIGTTYGGDGQSTFALPNLQSRVPIHQGTFAGTTFQLAEASGTESVTLS